MLGFSLLCLAPNLQAKRTHSYRSEIWTPEEELAGFELLDGFVIELVASEEDGIVNPIDLTFDDAGRLWTQTAVMYPLDPFADVNFGEVRKLMEDPDIMQKNPEFERILALYEGRTKGEDKILIIDDPYATNPSQPRVWADGLAIPQSILPYKDGAYVAQGSELFFLNDSDGDGFADERKRLLTDFGFIDTHTMAHLLVRGPGDWIHFSQGALNLSEVKSLISGNTLQIDYSKIVRMSMDGAQLELVSSGLNNIWGFQLRANGQWYGTEANDLTWSVVPMEPGTGFFGIGFTRMRPYQPWIPQLHEFRVGGTGISGLEFVEDSSNGFPPEWRDIALLANCITSTINCVRIVRNPDGSVSAEHLPDLLKSRDDWFRPVNMEFGPDGCLYIADWYNKIISHNELPRSHPERDKSHGRIWRIRHESQKPGKIPNLFEVPTKELVSHLNGPSLWEKRAAWHQITDRGAEELSSQLIKLAKDKRADVTTRIHALWSLEGIKHFSTSLMGTLLKSPEDELRREAIRALASFEMPPSRMTRYLKGFINDPNVMVRSQVLRTLADYGQANREIIDILVSYCRPDIPGEALGGPYERTFERYLARMALEQYESELIDYLDHSSSKKQPAEHRFWAIQALPLEIREPYFLALWDSINSKPWDKATFIEITNALDNKSIYAAAKPAFENLWNASHLASLANEVLDQVASEDLKILLKPAVGYLLTSQDQTDQETGLKAAEKYD
ncbi:MAG: HEAT repeat domain-containing protein, partial [Verrucomicrobia bacterium]|nr:HEAT repeat domain-containing protein [Verrucomicrobiota bacterium]